MNFRAEVISATGLAAADWVTLLRGRATRQGNLSAYRFLTEGDDAVLSYAELDRKARAIAGQFQSLKGEGERALLLFPPGLDYVAAFFGCLYANVIAVPANPPRRNGSTGRLRAIARDSRASFVLTTRQVQAKFETAFAQIPEFEAVRWLTVDGVPEGMEEQWIEPSLSGESLAFLQYTSGSTGTPKGVILTHTNLLHNSALIADAFEASPESQGLSWLPPYHDMGLIGGILQPAYVGLPVTLMSPMSFLQQPFRWLQAISRFQATISGGPNFAYELCLQRITAEQRSTLDLSSWRVAFNGAEPVRAGTMDRFAEVFASCGFRREAFHPCYGLAEATLIVSGGGASTAPTAKTFDAYTLKQNRALPVASITPNAKTIVGCGHALAGQRVAIVDPESFKECEADHIGEIWISGPSVAQGYWNRPQETNDTFSAHLASGDQSPSFLRTGDLGFLHEGELFVTGRLKDLIIIRGTNHYPQDIEWTVEKSHPSLRAGGGAAFSVDVAGEERLVIVQELERHHPSNLEPVIDAIREALSEHHELDVHAVLLLRPGTLPRTTSGKVQRYACRDGFLSGGLDIAGQWAQPLSRPETVRSHTTPQNEVSEKEIEAWLVDRIAKYSNSETRRVDVHQPFARYGLDSVTAVRMSGELEQWLDRRLPPTLAWEYPTIATLARFLAGDSARSDKSDAIETNVHAAREPIAIIGIGCRFPGAGDANAFWQLLRDGVDAITEVPPERWDTDALAGMGVDAASRANLRWGGFLPQVDEFDAAFFGISAREAVRMDPQHRLLLEVTWEALADAGQLPERLSGSRTGVFIGISNDDYGRIQFDNPDLIDPYACTGNALSVAANRISYLLNLRGPSMAIDTACSSSLVAVHLACQSLWNNESSLAVAGGVNLILAPWVTLNFARSGFMGSDGRCRAFDADADGYVRGEGCGAVVLKPLSKATADGDPIYALIRASAVNQDGRSNGLTAPSREAQEQVLREAYKAANISPGAVQYVEAHGTGTFLGDPIEARALGAVLAGGRAAGSRCALGSVKTNIGHLESAAGIAGLIKTALALKHRVIPPSLNFRQPNPHIPFAELPLRVHDTLAPWPADSSPAIAGVSSFGFGGTNAHVVLQEAPGFGTAVPEPPHESDLIYLLPLSAHTPEALQTLAAAYRTFLEQEENGTLHDICYTAGTRRTHHACRAALVGRNRTELIARLDELQVAGPRLLQATPDLTESANRANRANEVIAVAESYVQGGEVDFEALFPDKPRTVRLPLYPWQRQRYWVEEAKKAAPVRKDMSEPGALVKTEFIRRLEQAMPGERHELLLEEIQRQVGRVIGLNPPAPLDIRKPLNELGLDSLMAVELRNALTAATGRSLPATFLFEYPTIDAITAYIAGLLQPRPQRETSNQPITAASLDGLSGEELMALLEQKLAAIEAGELR